MKKLSLCIVLLLFSTLAYGQRDKVYHTSAGFGITLSVSAITHKPTLGLFAGIGAGVAKELWDTRYNKRADESVKDALATTAGSVGGYALWKLVLARKRPKIAAVPQTQPQAENPPPLAIAAGQSR